MSDAIEPPACPSPQAGGRQDRCGLFSFPPRCTPGHCTMPDAITAPVEPAPKYDPMTGKLIDRPSRKPLYILVAIVVAVVGAGYLVFADGGDDKHEMIGIMQLLDADGNGRGTDSHDCAGGGGYDDIDEGHDVRIENQDGKIIGSGDLYNGTRDELVDRMSINPANSGSEAENREDAERLVDVLDESVEFGCILLWEADVPDAEIYSITLSEERGSLTYTQEELEEDGWFVAITLGDE